MRKFLEKSLISGDSKKAPELLQAAFVNRGSHIEHYCCADKGLNHTPYGVSLHSSGKATESASFPRAKQHNHTNAIKMQTMAQKIIDIMMNSPGKDGLMRTTDQVYFIEKNWNVKNTFSFTQNTKKIENNWTFSFDYFRIFL